MQEMVTRVAENLVARLDGPLHFRFILQPLMAIFFAVRDGIKDAHEGRTPYFWDLFTASGRRKELLAHGWKSVGKIFILAIVLDAIYQLWFFHRYYPGESLIVAFCLAFVPYIIVRGPVNRIVSREGKHPSVR